MAIQVVKPLSDDEVGLLVRLLARVDADQLPSELRREIDRLNPPSVIYVVPLRMTPDGNVEVLLQRYNSKRPVLADQHYVPSTAVTGSDRPGSFDGPLRRILSNQLNVPPSSSLAFVEADFDGSGRGLEVRLIYWVQVDQSSRGVFYDAHRLPATMVVSQAACIQAAAHSFQVAMARK